MRRWSGGMGAMRWRPIQRILKQWRCSCRIPDVTSHPPASGFRYVQHLGNNRILFADLDDDGVVEKKQEDHFYPFGMRMAVSGTTTASPPNRYLYNGKELQTDLDLNWYDYGARMYDPSIARWNGVDALAEDYQAWSPYNYVMGNPIIFIDPNGLEVIYVNEDGTVVKFNDQGDAINASENTLSVINRVNNLRENSKLFNRTFSILDNDDNRNTIVRVNNATIEDYEEKTGTNTGGGLANRESGEIYFSSDAQSSAIPEEFFHILQGKIYGDSRSEAEIEAEAKLFDNTVLTEAGETTTFAGSRDALSDVIDIIKGRDDKEVTKSDKKLFKKYTKYLKKFEKYYKKESKIQGRKHPYSGEQRQLEPEAYNITTK